MVHKATVKNGLKLFFWVFALICNSFCVTAQELLNEKFKEDASKWYGVEYELPKDYFGIADKHDCFDPHTGFIQSSIQYNIKYSKHDIVVAFALVAIKPDDTPREIRIRKVFGDPNKINPDIIGKLADTTLSKVKYLDTLQLQTVNANRGVIYNMKINNKYLLKYPQCKKIELYKDNVARAEILFFYNKGDDALVGKEIERTWGMLQFK